jgi:hypothetical protein
MSNLINDIFLALTSQEVDLLKKFASFSKFKKDRNEYKLEEFRNCLSVYKMEEYTEPLYYYMILAKKRNFDYEKRNPISLMNRKDQLEYEENLVNLLKILLDENSIKLITIKCKETLKLKPIQVRKAEDIKIMANAAIYPIWEKIEQLGLNWFSMTREEAIEEINNHTDLEWTKSWMGAMGYVDPDYASFTLEKFEDYYRALGWGQVIPTYHEILREDFIAEYRDTHQIELPLNLETIERILYTIKEEKSRRGRKEDTYILKSTAYQLNVLKHAERYLRNIAVESILDIPISKDDYYFIHDVLVFFGFIISYKDNPDNEDILNDRIWKLIHAYNDPADKRDIDEKFRLLRHQTLSSE